MSQSNLFDPRRMFEHGCAFADCAKACETEPNHIEYRTHSHTVSGIVNSAFACEIFLKTLLVLHEVPAKGHNLKVLWKKYRKADEETALSIEQGMKAWFNSQNEKMFDEMLADAYNAFEHWRYIYEKNSAKINPHFLRGLRIILRDTCCKRMHGKSWAEYIQSPLE